MKSSRIRQNGFAILAALIWGSAFVAQSVSADFVEPFTFNALRAAVAFIFLLVLSGALRLFQRRRGGPPQPLLTRQLLIGGLCCGAALTISTNLQQKGLETTSAGKAGFITALYIVIVPILGLFLKRKPPRTIWLGVALAVAGLYCLCIDGSFSISSGDFYIMLCALCFSVHILLVDHFTASVNGVELSCVQFFTVTLLSALGMLLTEHPVWAGIQHCMASILYVGIFSSGVAYTLQILAQKDSNPTVISLLLSLEAVFATVTGALILGDQMTGREYLGCALMLAAVVLAQLPAKPSRASGAD